MSYSTIQFHPGPRVASIVLNRPPLNIINLEMLDELNAAWSEVEDHMPGKIESMIEKFHHLIRRIRKSDCITIAAIHGYTFGGGSELAMVCDLVIAAGETQIGQPEISLGCYPPVAAAYLPGAIGFHKASEMVLMGEPIHAAEAERAGLVNRVVPRTNLSEAVDAYVAKLLAKSSTVLALTKQALREGAGHHFEKALDRSQELYLRDLTRTEDMVEGMNAFLEKRPPAWRNR